jgi:hypothetical protein
MVKRHYKNLSRAQQGYRDDDPLPDSSGETPRVERQANTNLSRISHLDEPNLAPAIETPRSARQVNFARGCHHVGSYNNVNCPWSKYY